jgi:single-stranded DNA-binding protein
MFNNVILIGYLGSDAESRSTRNKSTSFRSRQS